MYFHNSLIPRGAYFLLPIWRINTKLPQGKTSQNAFQRSRSIKSEKYTCQNGHIHLVWYGGFCNQGGLQPPMNLKNKCLNAYLVPWYGIAINEPPLSTHTKKSTNISCMTSKWRHNCWFYPNCWFTLKCRSKLNFFAKNIQILEFHWVFAYRIWKWHF